MLLLVPINHRTLAMPRQQHNSKLYSAEIDDISVLCQIIRITFGNSAFYVVFFAEFDYFLVVICKKLQIAEPALDIGVPI